MIDRIIKYLNPSLLVLIFYITEAYFKIILFSTGELIDLLKITKGIVLLVFTLCLFIKKSKQLLLLGLLFGLFIIGQSRLVNDFSTPIILNFIKLIFPIILLLFFSEYKLKEKQKKSLFLAFEYLIFFNSLIIIIGFLFKIKIFSSYIGYRFGYNGLLVTSATGSYVYCITLIYLLAKYKTEIFKRIPNLIIIVSMFFIGTKICYLFLFCFLGIYMWRFIKINKKIAFSFLLISGFIVLYLAFFEYGVFNEIRQKEGLLSAIMSYRDQLLFERTVPYIKEHWNIVNYFFGGVSDLTTKSQIEFIDIFYFFGLIGGFLYYYIFFKVFLVFKSNFYIKKLLSILFIIILLAGNFFSYSSIAIYIVILREYLKTNE